MIIDGEDAGNLGLHHLEACMDKNRKKERKFTLSRFETGWCVVLNREYCKGIRDKGGGSKFRKQTSEIMCMRCLNIQPVGPICSTPSCNGLSMAKYYCNSCKPFDVGRSIYHCPFCNLCHVGKGLSIDYFHYMKCNCCLSISIMNYKYREKCLQANCPICNDFLFTSTSSIRALPCGHLMHGVCLEAFPRSHYSTCPVCCKSSGNIMRASTQSSILAGGDESMEISDCHERAQMKEPHTSEHPQLLHRLKNEIFFSGGENCERILLDTLFSDAKFLPSMEVAHSRIKTYSNCLVVREVLNKEGRVLLLGITNRCPSKNKSNADNFVLCAIESIKDSLGVTMEIKVEVIKEVDRAVSGLGTNFYVSMDGQICDHWSFPLASYDMNIIVVVMAEMEKFMKVTAWEFMVDSLVLPLGECDVTIGAQWLYTFEPVFRGFQEYSLFADMHFKKLISQRSFGFVPSSTCKGWVNRIVASLLSNQILQILSSFGGYSIRYDQERQCIAATEVLVHGNKPTPKDDATWELYHELKLRFPEIVNL